MIVPTGGRRTERAARRQSGPPRPGRPGRSPSPRRSLALVGAAVPLAMLATVRLLLSLPRGQKGELPGPVPGPLQSSDSGAVVAPTPSPEPSWRDAERLVPRRLSDGELRKQLPVGASMAEQAGACPRNLPTRSDVRSAGATCHSRSGDEHLPRLLAQPGQAGGHEVRVIAARGARRGLRRFSSSTTRARQRTAYIGRIRSYPPLLRRSRDGGGAGGSVTERARPSLASPNGHFLDRSPEVATMATRRIPP